MQMRKETGQSKWRNLGLFLLGFATITPWLVLNYAYSLGVTPGSQTFTWHSEAPRVFWHALMTSPSSSIFWMDVLPFAIYSSIAMFRDGVGRCLIVAFLIAFATIFFVFTSTSAYQFLRDETTIHRTLMQFSGMAILTVTYGVWLKGGFNRKDKPSGKSHAPRNDDFPTKTRSVDTVRPYPRIGDCGNHVPYLCN